MKCYFAVLNKILNPCWERAGNFSGQYLLDNLFFVIEGRVGAIQMSVWDRFCEEMTK